MKNIIAFILVAFILASCSLAKPLNQAVTAAEQLATFYDQDISSLLSTASLTQQEMEVIGNSLQTANRIRARLDTFKGDPSVNLVLVEMEYGRLNSAYKEVREIALANRDEYDADTWRKFETFDTFALLLDAEFANLLEATKVNEAIVNTISLANSIIRIAALL